MELGLVFIGGLMETNSLAREEFIKKIILEVEYAQTKHGVNKWGRHEFYGILKEEVDELWDDIKSNADQEKLLEELIQVAAVCLRYFESGDRIRGNFTDG